LSETAPEINHRMLSESLYCNIRSNVDQTFILAVILADHSNSENGFYTQDQGSE